MKTLDKVLKKEQYQELSGQKVMFDGAVVVVARKTKDNRYGSYATGFRFSTTVYGYLTRSVRKNNRQVEEISMNHGQTWCSTMKEAFRSKGKVILSKSIRGEFAYDKIQQLHREYMGRY